MNEALVTLAQLGKNTSNEDSAAKYVEDAEDAEDLEDLAMDSIPVRTSNDFRLRKKIEDRKGQLCNVRIKGYSVGLEMVKELPKRVTADRFDHWQVYAIVGNKQVLLEGNGSADESRPESTKRTGHVYE